MAQKTVLKILLSKFAPLSVEMQSATIVDQSVVNNADTLDVTYADNIEPVLDPMRERIESLIKTATSTSELLEIAKGLPPEYANDLDILESIEAWKAELLIAKSKIKSNAKTEVPLQQSAQPNDWA